MASAIFTISITLVAAALAAAAQYLFKRHVRIFEFSLREIITILTHTKTLIGVGFYLIGFLLYLYALNGTPTISLIYPIFSSSFIFIFLISKHVLHEDFSRHRTIGVLLIMAGILLISLTFPK